MLAMVMACSKVLFAFLFGGEVSIATVSEPVMGFIFSFVVFLFSVIDLSTLDVRQKLLLSFLRFRYEWMV